MCLLAHVCVHVCVLMHIRVSDESKKVTMRDKERLKEGYMGGKKERWYTGDIKAEGGVTMGTAWGDMEKTEHSGEEE